MVTLATRSCLSPATPRAVTNAARCHRGEGQRCRQHLWGQRCHHPSAPKHPNPHPWDPHSALQSHGRGWSSGSCALHAREASAGWEWLCFKNIGCNSHIQTQAVAAPCLSFPSLGRGWWLIQAVLVAAEPGGSRSAPAWRRISPGWQEPVSITTFCYKHILIKIKLKRQGFSGVQIRCSRPPPFLLPEEGE